MTAFVRVDACPLELVNALVEQVINESSGSTTFVNIIRFLVAVAEIHPHLYGRLAHWSAEKLSRGVDYSNLTVSASNAFSLCSLCLTVKFFFCLKE